MCKLNVRQSISADEIADEVLDFFEDEFEAGIAEEAKAVNEEFQVVLDDALHYLFGKSSYSYGWQDDLTDDELEEVWALVEKWQNEG